MEKCEFNVAIEASRNFAWHTFCDCYVEAVKDRLYRVETYGEAKKRSAQYALYETLFTILQLLAPVIPHVTEEIYQTMYADNKRPVSLQLSSWPVMKELVNNEAEAQGDTIIAVIGAVRREKADKHLPLNMPIKRLVICAEENKTADAIKAGIGDITGACKVEKLEVNVAKATGTQVTGCTNVWFNAEY
jgi:valyl-tRNA synthetase